MLMPSSLRIDGSATFTTVLSSMIMNRPTATATSVHHLRFSAAKSRARMPKRLVNASHPAPYGYPYASRVSEFVWRPTPEQVESANLTRLATRLGVGSYHDLHRISVEEPERFWPAVIEDLGLEFSEPWERVVDTSRGIEWAIWFVGGRLNLADSCVHRWAAQTPDGLAAIFLGEDGDRREWTWAEFSREVTRLAAGLRASGVEPGDRVAIYMPMSPQVAIASHACAHIGAVQVPIFSGFAATAVAQRLQDSGANVLITADRSLRRGQWVPMLDIAREARSQAPSVELLVVWQRYGNTRLDD